MDTLHFTTGGLSYRLPDDGAPLTLLGVVSDVREGLAPGIPHRFTVALLPALPDGPVTIELTADSEHASCPGLGDRFLVTVKQVGANQRA